MPRKYLSYFQKYLFSIYRYDYINHFGCYHTTGNMFKKAVYFALLAGTYAQSNGTIDLADPEPGNWGGNIGKAATKHYNDFDYEVFTNDSYIPRPYRYELGSDYTVNEVSKMW